VPVASRWESVRSVALVMALVLVVVLALQNRSLRADLTRARLRAVIPPVGLTVPGFRAVTLAGDSVTLGAGTTGQVLFFFNTTCGFCRANLPAWGRITARARQTTPTVAVFGVTVDSDTAVRAYVARHRVAFEVIQLRDSTLPLLYRADAVPLTLVLSPAGRVLVSRAGVLTAAAVDSIVQSATGTEARSGWIADPTLSQGGRHAVASSQAHQNRLGGVRGRNARVRRAASARVGTDRVL
jgi:hypothetical protein